MNLDCKFTLADNDLSKVNQACLLNNIKVHYPYLDSNIIAYSRSLQSSDKVTLTQLRPFFKKSMNIFSSFKKVLLSSAMNEHNFFF